MTPELIEQARIYLHRHEGYSRFPYKDTVGKVTIGYGRNLDDVGIMVDEADFLLTNDIKIAIAACERLFVQFYELSLVRQAVLVDMAYNMGENRLGMFSRMRAFIDLEDFDGAAAEMLNSRWATQVGKRANELADLMRRG